MQHAVKVPSQKLLDPPIKPQAILRLQFLVCCPPGCYNLAKGITFIRRLMAQKKAAKKVGKNARKKGAEYLRKGPKK
jgi:hypothetical protein